jgi:hypothetical protein
MKHTVWFEYRRDFFVATVVRDFNRSAEFFHCIKKASDEKRLDYDLFNTWVGTADRKGMLWQLKDMCHMLWGDADPTEQTDKFMFDWITGTIFHEAMKLKENCYMLHRYEPLIKKALLSKKIQEKSVESQYADFFHDTMNDLKTGLSRIECMFRQAEQSLVTLLRGEKNNRFLIRYLLDEHEKEENASGSTGKILETLFGKGLAEAYCVAGDSYLEGSWYTAARSAYEKALNIDMSCDEARSGLRILEKRLKELASVVERQYPPGTSS